jgi:aspartyl-tRNA(Asn)/glutamyl-tRNA(Gln) amidotransferase subunit A
MLELFDHVDAILAPATPCTAPGIGQETFILDGVELPVRPNLGIFTQPISFIGLPVVAVPVPLEPMPIGVQVIAAPWREDVALSIAHTLESAGVATAPLPRDEESPRG